jgi:membrane-associated phospholipid phosphatase
MRLLYLASFLPILLAFFISASRVHDFWHHPADIVAGSTIGIGCAFIAHGMWYPSVYSEWAGCPLNSIHSLTSSSNESSSLLLGAVDEEKDEDFI